MTKEEVIEWMVSTADDATNYEKTGLGFAMADINEFGFERWLKLGPAYVCESFLGTTQDVSENLMSDFRLSAQEQALDDLGVEQTMRVDQSGLIEALSKGMIDIMKSMHHYLLLQQEANFMYNDQQQHKDCGG